MTAGRAPPLVAVLTAVAVLALPVVPAAGAGTAGAAADPVDCFPGDGHDFVIGTGGPRIHLTVHLSLFTNLGGPGTLGMEAVGTTGRHEVVRLRTGVLFAGVEDAGTLLSNPFAPFAVAYQYRFQLPMFAGVADGDFAYEEEGSPVQGPVEEADCAGDLGGA